MMFKPSKVWWHGGKTHGLLAVTLKYQTVGFFSIQMVGVLELQFETGDSTIVQNHPRAQLSGGEFARSDFLRRLHVKYPDGNGTCPTFV